MLWTAPELLYKRHAGLNTRKAVQGTQPGDIYSFAIILQEILYRALPYQATGEQTMVTKGIIIRLPFTVDRLFYIAAGEQYNMFCKWMFII